MSRRFEFGFANRGRRGPRPASTSASRRGDVRRLGESGGVAMVRRRLTLEHTDIEIHEIESSRQITATSLPVARECKKLTTLRLVHTTINRR